ncbi:MAG: hypothetical protein JKY86_09840 [Gammaproteobacteria bacterium]|nr:hypothetical protein [Gammaproteobacteria bacterium]
MSLIKNFKSYAVLLLVFVHQIALAQTETAATLPASFVGTYNLTYSLSAAGGPFSSNQAVTLVVGSDNSLCVDGKTLTSPVLRNGNAHEAIWKDATASVEYALSSLVSGFNEVNVGGLGGSPFYGQLRGSKSSDATSCSSTTPAPLVTASMMEIFELAESKLADFFPAGAVTLFLDSYVYRFYEATGVYLAFADGNVFLLGGGFGEAVVSAGSISSVLTALEVYEVGGGSTASTDLWNLSISGTLTTFGNTINFSGISLANIPAPDLDNTSEINEEINSTLAGVATGISSIAITVVNNSSTQRTFDVAFSATANGIAISYSLRYDYTK